MKKKTIGLQRLSIRREKIHSLDKHLSHAIMGGETADPAYCPAPGGNEQHTVTIPRFPVTYTRVDCVTTSGGCGQETQLFGCNNSGYKCF